MRFQSIHIAREPKQSFAIGKIHSHTARSVPADRELHSLSLSFSLCCVFMNLCLRGLFAFQPPKFNILLSVLIGERSRVHAKLKLSSAWKFFYFGHHQKIIIYDNFANLSKRMKILSFVVCFLLAQVLKVNSLNEINSSIDENDRVVLKVISALNEIKSSQCRNDLNLTVNAFRDRRPWAVASKNKSKCKRVLRNLRVVELHGRNSYDCVDWSIKKLRSL